ncbi:hypothetical protein Tco_0768416 [Tanacetum coccineum]
MDLSAPRRSDRWWMNGNWTGPHGEFTVDQTRILQRNGWLPLCYQTGFGYLKGNQHGSLYINERQRHVHSTNRLMQMRSMRDVKIQEEYVGSAHFLEIRFA